jgi:hypothetical protein
MDAGMAGAALLGRLQGEGVGRVGDEFAAPHGGDDPILPASPQMAAGAQGGERRECHARELRWKGVPQPLREGEHGTWVGRAGCQEAVFPPALDDVRGGESPCPRSRDIGEDGAQLGVPQPSQQGVTCMGA